MNKKNKLAKNSSIRTKKISNKMLILNINTLKTFVCDNVGKEIILLINQKRNAEEIIKILTRRWKCEKKDIEKNILDFLDSLIKNQTVIELKNGQIN